MTQEHTNSRDGESASPCAHPDHHVDSGHAPHDLPSPQQWQDHPIDIRDKEFDLSHLHLRKIFTLIFIHDQKNQRLLLGKKVRGPLTGQWNGFGGKVERGLDLSIADSAARELLEEAFLEAPLFPVGFVQWVVSPQDASTSGSGEQAKDSIYRDIMIVYKAHSFTVQQPQCTVSSSVAAAANADGTTNLQEEFLVSDEMAPAWWPVSDLPWEQMRINHKVWYPLLLADRVYRAVYWYQTYYSDYDQEKSKTQNGSSTKTGAGEDKAGGTNAQRETAKEIWVEDLEKRCIQFGPEVHNNGRAGTLPSKDIQARQEQRQQEQARLDEFAIGLGLLKDDDGRSHYGQVVKTNSDATKTLEPTYCESLDESWMGQAISKIEKNWLVVPK